MVRTVLVETGVAMAAVCLVWLSSCGGGSGTALSPGSRPIERQDGGSPPPEDYVYNPSTRMYTMYLDFYRTLQFMYNYYGQGGG